MAEYITIEERVLDADGNVRINVPASYANVDERGNVLYLDEDRRTRKERPDKPLYRNKPNGLGIKNFLVTHLSARDWNWKIVLAAFRKIVAWSAFMKQPESRKSKIYKKAMFFEPQMSTYSYGTVYNLNVDADGEDGFGTRVFHDAVRVENGSDAYSVTEPAIRHAHEHGRDKCNVLSTVHDAARGKRAKIELNKSLEGADRKVTVPADLVKKAIMEAQFIGGMKECLCRAGQDCQDYPHDLACLFLNMGGKVVVDHGMAVELTKEEAIARVDRAAELGLTCQSLWVEVEQLIWGFRNDEMDAFLEICFCCPCCCVAFNLSKNATDDVKRRFSPTGFTATVDHEKCIGCKRCLDKYCPQDAISFRASDGKMVVNQETCVGCGICRAHCPEEAIAIKQTMPMRERMHDYFYREGRLDIVPGKQFEGRKPSPLDPALEAAVMTTVSVAASAVSAASPVAEAVRSHVDSKANEDGGATHAEEILASAAVEAVELAEELKEDIASKRNS
jgi:Pyruvate/2-oxoacid:ferredoxin oxidoreductase delta subunit